MNQPHLKKKMLTYIFLDHFPPIFIVENKKGLKPPPSLTYHIPPPRKWGRMVRAIRHWFPLTRSPSKTLISAGGGCNIRGGRLTSHYNLKSRLHLYDLPFHTKYSWKSWCLKRRTEQSPKSPLEFQCPRIFCPPFFNHRNRVCWCFSEVQQSFHKNTELFWNWGVQYLPHRERGRNLFVPYFRAWTFQRKVLL